MLKKLAGELQDGGSDADDLFAKGASVKLLASKTDVGSKELSKVSLNDYVLSLNYSSFAGGCNCVN